MWDPTPARNRDSIAFPGPNYRSTSDATASTSKTERASLTLHSNLGADGALGFGTRSPYDRIFATASCAFVPEPWVEQLAEQGILMLPFAFSSSSTLYPIIEFRKRGNDLLGTVSSRLSIVSFLPLYGSNLAIPVRHNPQVGSLERKITWLLSIGADGFERSRAAQLAAMLHLAEAIERDPHTVTQLRVEDILTKTRGFLKRRQPRSVKDFVFRLSLVRDEGGHHLWSFHKGDRTLYVDCQS